jgi:DNA-binding HxlR family transcriptional regulator
VFGEGLRGVELYLCVGVLANIAALCNDSADGRADFGVLRESSRLLPETLVGMLDELRIAGYIRYEENHNGNPYGILRMTPMGREFIDQFGDQAEQYISNCPERYKISAPERSTRRGGKRNRPDHRLEGGASAP